MFFRRRQFVLLLNVNVFFSCSTQMTSYEKRSPEDARSKAETYRAHTSHLAPRSPALSVFLSCMYRIQTRQQHKDNGSVCNSTWVTGGYVHFVCGQQDGVSWGSSDLTFHKSFRWVSIEDLCFSRGKQASGDPKAHGVS
jgi:hypothetical protein